MVVNDAEVDQSDPNHNFPNQTSMKLMCQIYCPLTGSLYHRTLFIYACANKRCWNDRASWCVVRAQVLSQADDVVENEENLKHDLFDLDDDWGDDAEDDRGGVVDSTRKSQEHVVVAPTSISTKSFAPPRIDDSSGDDDDLETDASSCKSSCVDADADAMEAEAVNDDNVVDDDAVAERERLLTRLRGASASGASESTTSGYSLSASSPCFDHFDAFFVACVEEEVGSRSSLDSHVQKLLKDYKKMEGDPEGEDFLDQFDNLARSSSSSSSGAASRGRKSAAAGSQAGTGSASAAVAEKYEKGIPKHGHLLFQNFLDVLSSFPSQILRYSWSGSPLLMTPLKNPPPPIMAPNGDDLRDFVCLNCGASKVFEMQLLPTLLNYLKLGRSLGVVVDGIGCGGGNLVTSLNHSVDGALMDFGTAMVFSCEKSCWNEAEPRLMRETIVLQEEPGKEFARRENHF